MDFQSVAYIAMLNGKVETSLAALTEVKVGATAMEGRKWLYILNASTVPIYIGSQIALGTPVTGGANGTLAKRGIKMAAGDSIWLPVNDNITIYAMSHSGNSNRLRIAELG